MTDQLNECLNEYFQDIEAWVMATEDYDTVQSIMLDYEHRAENALWVEMITENMLICDGTKIKSENAQLIEILTFQYRIWCASNTK